MTKNTVKNTIKSTLKTCGYTGYIVTVEDTPQNIVKANIRIQIEEKEKERFQNTLRALFKFWPITFTFNFN